MIKVNPNILCSDENIIGTLAHEVYEAGAVAAAFHSQGGRLRTDVLNKLVNPKTGTLHCEAWDVGDDLVLKFRSKNSGE